MGLHPGGFGSKQVGEKFVGGITYYRILADDVSIDMRDQSMGLSGRGDPERTRIEASDRAMGDCPSFDIEHERLSALSAL